MSRDSPPEQPLSFHPATLVGTIWVSLFGAFVVSAWLLGNAGIELGWLALFGVKPNLGIGFLLSGIGLHFACVAERKSLPRAPADVIGGVIALIGAATLSQDLFGVDLRIDQLIAAVPAEFDPSHSPGRMAPTSALNLILAGVVIVGFRRLHAWAHEAMCFSGAFIAMLAFVGHVFGERTFYGLASYTPMSTPTSVGFMLFFLAALFSRRSEGVMRVFTGDTLGGALARGLIPAAILIPALTTGIAIWGTQEGFFGARFGLALVVVLTMVFFTLLVGGSAILLARVDTERKHMVSILRESEEHYRQLFENNPNPMFVYERESLRILDANHAALEQYGYSRTEFLDLTLFDLHPLDDPERLRESTRMFPTTIRRPGIWKEVRKDGSVLDAEITTHDLMFEGREARLVLALDVTERVRADTALRQALGQLARHAEELEKKNEEIEAFVYTVSHDLRAPLVNLQGFSRELALSCEDLRKHLRANDANSEDPALEQILQSDISGALKFITASVDKFERLINALLQLSRTGRQELRMETLNLNEIARNSLDSMRKVIDERGAEVRVAELPEAWGDRTAIDRVLSNLVSNALNYLHPDRPGTVDIGGESNGEFTRCWVRDNGLGIPASAMPRLFQVFQRFHPERSPGEGMGLAIVKRIIERHGGRVWVESQEGEGSTFSFSIPKSARERSHD